MSTRQESATDEPLITAPAQLIEPMARGEKPAGRWRIGTEHEKLVFRRRDHSAPAYADAGGIRDLLAELTGFGWEPVEEIGPDGNSHVIALSGADGGVSLEPAGQLELSGAPLDNLHDTDAATASGPSTAPAPATATTNSSPST